jgi:hypothetical protein
MRFAEVSIRMVSALGRRRRLRPNGGRLPATVQLPATRAMDGAKSNRHHRAAGRSKRKQYGVIVSPDSPAIHVVTSPALALASHSTHTATAARHAHPSTMPASTSTRTAAGLLLVNASTQRLGGAQHPAACQAPPARLSGSQDRSKIGCTRQARQARGETGSTDTAVCRQGRPRAGPGGRPMVPLG